MTPPPRVFGQHEPGTLAQLADVASRASRAALMADGHLGYVMPIGGVAAYENQVSVVGVGFDIACLAAGTRVVTRDGYHVPIEVVEANVPALCWDGTRTRAIDPLVGHVSRDVRPTLALRLTNGRELVATADHQLRTPDGWRAAGTLAVGDRVACQPFVGVAHAPYAARFDLDLRAYDAEQLRERDLLPLRGDDARFATLVRLLGYVSGDGHLAKDGNAVSVYTVHEPDAADIAADFTRLGFHASTYRRDRGPRRQVEIRVRVSSTALHALFSALGSPVGRKRWAADAMPWLFDAPDWVRAQFLSAFASAEMMTPRRHVNGVIPNLQLKQAGEDDGAIRFVARLCESLGFAVSVAPSGAAYGTRRAWVLQILGGAAVQVAFAERVGFCYALEKRRAAAAMASVAWAHDTLVASRTSARDEARALHAAGGNWRDVTRDVAARHGVSAGFAYHAIYGQRGEPRRLPGAAVTPEVDGEICWVPVASVANGGERAVYDVITADVAECFLAEGIVAHNCGNAAIRTNLSLGDLGATDDARHKALSHLADQIAETVSFGMGRKNQADDAPTDDPLFHDEAWYEVPVKERKTLKTKARQQLGTVGSGNHYVDVFVDEAGALWVGVHFGSRGFGHSVASGFLSMAQGKKWGERVPEAEVLLDVESSLGSGYWTLMNLAGRYAYAGREWVARKVVSLMGGTELELVHNHHNFCVPGDALIPTPEGPKPMRDLRSGDRIYAFDAEVGCVETIVLDQWRVGIKRTRTIQTASRRLTVTDDHPILTVHVESHPHPERPWMQKRRGSLRWKNAGDVDAGDIVVCAQGYYDAVPGDGVDAARLAGAMLGDGWVRHEPRVSGYTVGLAIGTHDDSHTAVYQQLLERELPAANWNVDKPGAFGLTCSSAAVWRDIQERGLGGYSGEKRVPRWVFSATREEKLALLAGYVDSDGSIANAGTSNHGRCQFASTNRELVQDLRELAIACSLRVTPVTAEERHTNFGDCTVFRCTMSADSAHELPLWHHEKASNQRATTFRKPIGLEEAQLGHLTLPRGVFAQRVTRVESSAIEQEVFDLSVEHHSHSFLCEGVVVHNCWVERHEGQDLHVVRKGATPAFPGQMGFIGGSMGDDAVIVRGASPVPGSEADTLQREALYSTVHGAGRVMSRTQAAGKRNWRTKEIIRPGLVSPEMMHAWIRDKGVILRGGGLDESPQAYRRLPEVLAAQGPTIEVVHTLRPLVVAMAGADEVDPYKD